MDPNSFCHMGDSFSYMKKLIIVRTQDIYRPTGSTDNVGLSIVYVISNEIGESSNSDIDAILYKYDSFRTLMRAVMGNLRCGRRGNIIGNAKVNDIVNTQRDATDKAENSTKIKISIKQ